MGLVPFIYVYHIKVKKSSEEVYQKDNFKKEKKMKYAILSSESYVLKN